MTKNGIIDMLDVRFYVKELDWWASPKIRQITSVEWIAETSDLVVSIKLVDTETLQFVVVESKGVLHRDVYYSNNLVLKNVPDGGKVATLKLAPKKTRGDAAPKAVPTPSPLPTVSFLVITKDSAPHLDLCLSQAKLVNPTELVVCVNSTTKDNTTGIARKYTREVHSLDFHGHHVIEPVLNEAYDLCSSEWILRVDDDEILSSAFAELPLTLSKELSSGVCFPRYNCVDGTKRFIDVEPYYPDYQLRLFRKSAIKPHPGHVHVAQPLEGNVTKWDNNFIIFHLLYQLRTYSDRVARTKYYNYSRYPTIPLRPLQIFEDYQDRWQGHIAECKHKPLVAYRGDGSNNYRFRLVQIQTTSNCPARCVICGYKDSWMVKNPGTMSDELYVRILENLHQIDPLFSGQFCPYLMNEPFADKNLIERTQLAFKSLYNPFIEISSNLALATPDSIKSLVSVFEANNFRGRFVISHFGIDKDSFEHNMKLNYRVCLDNMITLIKEFKGKMEIKLNNFGASRDGSMKLYSYDTIVNYFNGIVKEHSLPSANLNVPHLSFHNRAGNVKMDGWGYKRVVRPIGKDYPFDCFRIHNCLHVLWNGEVVPCCMDYHRDEVLGNLSKQRIEEVLGSEKFENFSKRVIGVTPSATDFICCCCQSPGG